MAGWVSFRASVPAVCVLLTLIKETAGGKYCKTGYNSLRYCKYGCCGSHDYYNDEDCCGVDVALIVGAAVGGFVLICVIITVVCLILKKQGYRGRVVGPHPPGGGNNVTVVHSNNAAMGYVTAPPPPPPPPMGYPYGQPHLPPPPPYMYYNHAYPPPAPGAAPGTQGGGFAAPAIPGYRPVGAAAP